MPELPEVEYARRHLLRWLKASPVTETHAEKTRIFHGSPAAFAALRGKVQRVERRGKQLLLVFAAGSLRSHFGMTGKWVRRQQASERFSRAYFHLENGDYIHYCDPRMLGRLEPTDEKSLADRDLGPDALGITAAALRNAMGKSKLPIKVVLMDQKRLAGIGNIQASESLWRAKIDPKIPATDASWSALARAINASLRFTLAQQSRGEIRYVEEKASRNPFLVYGRKGEPCRRCKTPIATFTQALRTTFFCPHCQR